MPLMLSVLRSGALLALFGWTTCGIPAAAQTPAFKKSADRRPLVAKHPTNAAIGRLPAKKIAPAGRPVVTPDRTTSVIGPEPGGSKGAPAGRPAVPPGKAYWDPDKMPLKIFIQSGGFPPGYKSEFGKQVERALDKWARTSDGLVRFALINDCKQADVTIEWSERQTAKMKAVSLDSRGITTVMVENTHVSEPSGNKTYSLIQKCFITLLTKKPKSGVPLTEQEVYTTALHEVGHALGLMHSRTPSDIMFPTAGQSQDLSDGDQKALTGLYAPAYQLYNEQRRLYDLAVDQFNAGAYEACRATCFKITGVPGALSARVSPIIDLLKNYYFNGVPSAPPVLSHLEDDSAAAANKTEITAPVSSSTASPCSTQTHSGSSAESTTEATEHRDRTAEGTDSTEHGDSPVN